MLISTDGNKQTMDINAALSMADTEGLDLVQMSENNGTAVCKLMNYSKFLYDQKKKEKANNKGKQELKEVRMNDGTAENDLRIKAKTVSRLLKEGDKVKVSIIYKGRMIRLADQRGQERLIKFETMVEEPHNIDLKPKLDGNRVCMVLSPKTSK